MMKTVKRSFFVSLYCQSPVSFWISMKRISFSIDFTLYSTHVDILAFAKLTLHNHYDCPIVINIKTLDPRVTTSVHESLKVI